MRSIQTRGSRLSPGVRRWYYTAIIAAVVGPAGQVNGSEVRADLAARARENLSSYSNVTVVAAEGATFDPGMCDAMLLHAGSDPSSSALAGSPARRRPPAGPADHGHDADNRRWRDGENYSRRKRVFRADRNFAGNLLMCRSTRSATRTAFENCDERRSADEDGIRAPRSSRQVDTCIVHGGDVCLSSAEVVTTA
jgi:hypothetical protein